METLKLTKEDILTDLKVYEARLDRVKDRLGELPGNLKGRKLHVTRQRLRAEIKHVQGLLAMAREALAECEPVNDGLIK
jgi:hypothetical protein